MHHCIKYRLKENGTIPDFLCLDPNGVGGAYGVSSLGSSQHNDTIFIGISNNNAVGSFEIISTQQDLENYLASICTGWTSIDPNNPDEQISFNPATEAAWVWARKIALDASVGESG